MRFRAVGRVNLSSLMSDLRPREISRVPGFLCHHRQHAAKNGSRSASSGSSRCSGLPRLQSLCNDDTALSRSRNAQADTVRGLVSRPSRRVLCPPAARLGAARFPPTSASSLGHRSRPLVQLSKQGVSLSFWLTKSQRGTGGLNACVWTQAIIPNYSFSFEPARPAGEPAAEQAP